MVILSDSPENLDSPAHEALHLDAPHAVTSCSKLLCLAFYTRISLKYESSTQMAKNSIGVSEKSDGGCDVEEANHWLT